METIAAFIDRMVFFILQSLGALLWLAVIVVLIGMMAGVRFW